MAVAEHLPVVGREEHLQRLEEFVRDCALGPGTLLLEGEPGIGKTTLWRAGVDHARALGFRVLDARPAAAEAELSYAALADLLEPMHEAIDRLPSPQRRALRIALLVEESTGVPPDQRAVAAALLGLLRRLAEDGPVVVALDDVQWVDPPSVGALRFALRRLDGEPVRMLATVRGGSDDGFDAERIVVCPLSLQALDRLVRERLGTRVLRPTLRQLGEVSGGNPFYALEIAGSLLRSGHRVEPGDPLPIPSSLRELVRERLATLTPAAHEAAFVTAALAQPTVSAVQNATRESTTGLSEAVAADVLERRRETVRFTHPLLASILYEDRPLGERKALHRRLAAIVDDPEERARHLAEAAAGPDDELASAVEAAASSAAARGAPDTGARLAKQAFELTPRTGSANAHRRRLEWARHTIAAGDPQAAVTLLEAHLEVAGPGRNRAEVLLELGRARLATRGVFAAHECFERALRELEGAEEPELKATVFIELLVTDFSGDSLNHLALSEQAVALAEQSGSTDLLARALGAHGAAMAVRGRPPTNDFWQRALEVERESGQLRYAGPTGAYALAAWLRGDWKTAFETLERLAASMRRRGDPLLPQVLLGLCEAARVAGDWDSAAEYAQEAHALVVQTGRESEEPFCLLFKARVALPRGDLDVARAHVEEARALAAKLPGSGLEGFDAETMTVSVLAQIAEVEEHYAEAHEWTTAAIEKAEQLGPFMQHALAEMVAGDVKCLVALGSLDDATRQLERLIELRDAIGVPTLDGITLRTQGLVVAAQGDLIGAADYLERAVDTFDGLSAPWPMQLGWSLLELGRVRRRARHKQAARETLGRALDIFERHGARLWAEKTRAELSRIGGRPSRSGALTETEERIAGLVARGHSNAEVAHELFLSPKTVEWNLSKVYKKLHVRSRTELAARLARQAATR